MTGPEGSSHENQAFSHANTEADLDANADKGSGFLGRFVGAKDGQAARKTVTFGDAASIRSIPAYSLLALVLLIGFWWFATTPFGFPDDFKPVVDAQFDANADEAEERAEERAASGNPNEVIIPFRDPMQRDYLTACQVVYSATRDTIAEQDGDELRERLQPIAEQNVLDSGTTADDEAFAGEVRQERGRLVNVAVDRLADDRSACSPNEYTQLASPRTMPSPGDTWTQFTRLIDRGFKNVTLWEHAGQSLKRVLLGMFFACLIGIPLGFAMGLNSKLRSLLDTPVELFRPIPPLAVLPLFILWFGIGDRTAAILLFFAALWIMIIGARAGARTVKLSKVRAAYSLGASKRQVLFRVILPNALPELFTGVRVAFGVCWGTLVAAELVGAEVGLGSMIFDARANLRSDVVVVGIITIALIGVAIDVVIRFAESKLIPWRGKG